MQVLPRVGVLEVFVQVVQSVEKISKFPAE
jgi:hypothetical protein